MPDQGWYKYNTDGSSNENPGRSSWTYYLRDDQGDLVHVEGLVIEDTDNMEAKTQEILYVANHSKQSGQQRITIQTNSLAMENFISQKWEIPWKISDIIDQLKHALKGKQIIIQYIFKEGNQLADYLANLAIQQGDFIFTSFNQLPSIGKKILNSDKQQCPYMRLVPSKG